MAVSEKAIESYFEKRFGGKARVDNLYTLSGGACQDNYALDLTLSGGSNKDGDFQLVMRTDKGGSLLNSLSRVEEFTVAKKAFEAGVKTPQPYWSEADTDAIGHPFYFMERITGKATGRYVTRDKDLNAYRKGNLPSDVAANLARIHSIQMSAAGADLDFLVQPQSSQHYLASFLDQLRNQLDDFPEAHPVLELGLNWCEKNAPPVDDFVLIHGDFRTGNFMVSPDGMQGIVDWEFAHWGDRHEDIGWLCMRDWRFGKNNLPAGGFTKRETFYELYEEHAGVKVDPFKVRFWEIAGNIGWAIGAAQQGERHLNGVDKGIEFASIGRRVCEMEFEVMRLIEDAE